MLLLLELYYLTIFLSINHRQTMQISTSEKPLNADAAIRGAYVNAGSKDIGLDPNAGKYGSRNR